MSIFGSGGFGSGSGSGYGGRRSGCATIIGIAIILIGVIRYYSGSSVNPTTGEKQRVGNITPDQEMALGLQAAPQMIAQMGGEIPASNPSAAAVRRIGEYVVEHSVANKSPYHYQFHLLADPQTVNAFALPGGQVFITKALFDKLSDEAEVAGVLGHEVGHVVNRHSAQQMAKGQLGQMIVTGVGVAASDRQDGGYSAAMLAQLVEQTAMLHYSRDDESEADAFGLRVMTESGFDPRAMIDVMKVLEQSSGGSSRAPEFMVTHPYPEHRIEAIERWLHEHPEEEKQLTRGRPLR